MLQDDQLAAQVQFKLKVNDGGDEKVVDKSTQLLSSTKQLQTSLDITPSKLNAEQNDNSTVLTRNESDAKANIASKLALFKEKENHNSSENEGDPNINIW